MKIRVLFGDPLFLKRLHKWASIVWFVAAFPICIWFNDSLPLITFMSAYAIVTGHWSSWQSTRVEVKQDETK